MKTASVSVLLAGLSLQTAAGAQAPIPPPASPPAVAGTPSSATPEVQSLREEIARLRKEAEEERQRRDQEIRRLEAKLDELARPASGQPAPPAPNPPAAAVPTPAPITPRRPGFKARLYGFARADLDINSHDVFSHPQLAFWALSRDDPRRADNDGSFTIHPRLTRLGLDTEAPPLPRLGNASLTGNVEVDFLNFVPGNPSATSNSREFLRIRHAYGLLANRNVEILFGQTWDVIAPLIPAANSEVAMWNAGNLGDRRPQLRATWKRPLQRGQASLAVAALSGSAVDGANRDAAAGEAVLDGEQSGRPLVQARLALSQPAPWANGQSLELGLWGHNGAYRWDRARAIRGRRSFESNALGLDLRLPISGRLSLQGEGWLGTGLADIRGGVGQSINTVTGDVIPAHGGWAELTYRTGDFYSVSGGFTIDDPDNGKVEAFTGSNAATTGRTLNRTAYVANRFNVGNGLLIGVDWMLFDTHYRGLASGNNSRWNLWLQHSF